MDRRLFIVIAVIGFHALGLWALQTGLLRRAVELVVPVEVLAELIEPPQPQVAPAPLPPQPPQPPQTIQKQVALTKPVPKLAPQPMAIADPAPSASAPTGTTEPPSPAPPLQAPASRSEAPATATATATAIPKETIPSTNIDHRFRPQPPYPTLSTRLGEEGVVILKVMVGKDGRPLTVQVTQSSGYHRLDNVAERTVKNRWSFTPGTSNGVPVDMEPTVLIRFSIEP